MRELQATQEEFRRVASRLNGGDPDRRRGRKPKARPSAGRAARAGRAGAARRARRRSSTRSASSPSRRARRSTWRRRREFYRWTFASMWTPGPFEARPLRAFYYITDVDPSWPPERQDEHLRDFNYGALWSISIHEVFPGHFLHYQHLRQVESKLRKSILFSSTAFVEGWAHYCEQMMVEEGFRQERPDRPARPARRGAHPPLPLRSSASGCTARTCRSSRASASSATRRSSRRRSARREAERGTFDPVLRPLLGRQADDAEAAGGLQGAARGEVTRCGSSTTRCSPTARCRFGLQRALMLGTTDMLERSRARVDRIDQD